MRKLTVAALAMAACLLSTTAALTPDTLWVKRLDMGYDEWGYGIALRGNEMAVTGAAWTGSSNDILVARLNQDGDTVWARICDAGFDEAGSSVCLDSELNAFVTGFVVVYKDASTAAHRNQDVFGRSRQAFAEDYQEVAITAKYDSLGKRRWLRVDTSHMTVGAVTDEAGGLYLSGTINTGAGYDLWFAKLDTAGDTIWTRTYDLAPLEMGYRLAVDRNGNIAACAYVGDFEDFDCVALRLTPDGDTLWTRRYNRGPDDGCSAVAVDPDGNIIMVGKCTDETVSDGLVLKYSPSGALLWQRVIDFNTDDGFEGAACDSSGNIYVAGYTGFDYPHDCLTMKFDSTGSTVWAATYGGSGEDQAKGVVCDPEGNPIVVGYMTDTLTSGLDLLTMKYGALTGAAESPAPRPAASLAHSTITAAPYFVLSVPGAGRYDVELCDLTGRAAQTLHRGQLSEGPHRFSVAGLPSGSYFVRVAAPDGGISCQRLLLVK
jgi:hypothetical protein